MNTAPQAPTAAPARPRRVPPAYGVQGRKTRQLAAVVLGSQSPVVLFAAVGARALAAVGDSAPSAAAYLWVGLGLAVALAVGAGLLRRPYGVTLGWLLQVATLLTGCVMPVMWAVGLIFGALWVVALVQGPRLDALTEAYLRDHPEQR